MGRFIQVFLGFTVIGMLSVVSAHAQSPVNELSPDVQSKGSDSINRKNDPYPLRPADLSSPRDTLNSFLSDTELVVEQWIAAGQLTDATSYHAYSRSASALDFKTTPDGGSRWIQTHRILMLWEILGRLDLPSMIDIPGDDEVEEFGLAAWTFPNTRITIQRVEQGPRAGEFLFSEGTVERLDRFYRMVKDLPSPSNSRIGVYDEFLQAENAGAVDEGRIRDRLRPIDRSNPRSTLMGFLESVNLAYVIVTDADAALRASPPTMTKKESVDAELAAKSLMQQAITALDLREVPLAQENDVGMERALQLKEILDRMNLPPIDSIPNSGMVAVQRERLNRAGTATVASIRWRYPNTEIEIVEIREGEHQGNFQFSAGTVSELDDFYERVRDLPYRRDYTQIALDYSSPEVSRGFYEYYITTPGDLIPRASRLGRIVDRLPIWMKGVYFGQTAWQWCGLVIVVLIVVALSCVIQRVLGRSVRRLSAPKSQWLKMVAPMLVALIVLLAARFADNTLNLTGTVLGAVTTSGKAISIVLAACIVFSLCRVVAETIISLPRISSEGVDASLLRLSSSVIGAILFAWILVGGLHELGIDIIPLIAGLGIGGLAVALAARPTMENIIGSFMIFWDKPYQVGQRVKVLGYDGSVESIGLRSTRIRLLSGHVTSIPNEKMASVEIENVGRRPYIRRLLNVTLTYDTPPGKINVALKVLRDILSIPEIPSTEYPVSEQGVSARSAEAAGSDSHPNQAINQPGFPPRVYFNDLNSDSLNLLVIYWYHPAEHWDYLEHATWINVQIMERFSAEGIDFAFPTQTLHLAGDDNRPLTVGQRWESEDTESSPSSVVAQAAALGAWTVLDQQSSASDSVRPETKVKADREGKAEDEMAEATIEDDMLHGGNQGNDPGQQ